MERCLLDTMTVLWMALRPDLLGKKAAQWLENPEVDLAYSIVSLWEIGLKMAGKGYDGFELPADWDLSLPKELEAQRIRCLPVSARACRIIQDLPNHHRDPFDRMLIAQALHENLTVIGSDRIFEDYGVTRLW